MFPRFSLAILLERTTQVFKTAHVLVGPEEDLWCLDLDVHAPDQVELHRRIRERVRAVPEGAHLPAAPDQAWQSLHGGIIDRTERMRCPGARFNVLQLIYVRPLP